MKLQAEKLVSEQSQERARDSKQCPSCSAFEGQKAGALNCESLMNCANCGTVYDFKNLKEDFGIYSESYFAAQEGPQQGYFDYEADRLVNLVNFRARFNSIEKLVETKTAFLDVGCALGHALEVAKERGWKEVRGIDCSEFCIRTLRERGYQVTSDTLEALVQGSQKFDFIMMSDVIEHFSDPQPHLEAAFQLLKPGGVLFVHTPNSSSFSARLLKQHWFHFKPREHLVYFSKKGLQMTLERAGFNRVEVRASFSWLTLKCVLVRLKRWGWHWLKVFDFIQGLPISDIAVFPLPSGNMQAIAQKNRS